MRVLILVGLVAVGLLAVALWVRRSDAEPSDTPARRASASPAAPAAMPPMARRAVQAPAPSADPIPARRAVQAPAPAPSADPIPTRRAAPAPAPSADPTSAPAPSADPTSAPAPSADPTPARRVASTPARSVASTITPPSRTPPPGLYDDPGPVGAQTTDLTLVATTILPSDQSQSIAVLLDRESNQHVLVSQGYELRDYEVVKIALSWVQLRKQGAYHWVTYGKSRPGHSRTAAQPAPPPVVRPPLRRETPKVTFKWIRGRAFRDGELERHLQPITTAQGIKVGRILPGFNRIGVRVGDVIQAVGGRPVRSVEALRQGLQESVFVGATGRLTVLRNGQRVELDFGVSD